MVESDFVNARPNPTAAPPIGVLRALATGFDRVAARPGLIVPAFLLDLFLWLGPRLGVAGLLRPLAAGLTAPAGADAVMTEQVGAMRQALLDLASRFNLFSALSSLPVGLPSLMAARMPEAAPLGPPTGIDLPNGLLVLAVWLALSLVGLGLGSLFHVWVARQVAPRTELLSAAAAWGRMALLSLAVYAGALTVALLTLLVASAAAYLVPLLGLALAFLGFSLLFWAAVYLIFTPHGIIRHRLSVFRSVLESVQIVRWNMLGTVSYLSLGFLVSYATNWVWSLPLEDSWYALLAVVGHAFVSATLLAGSYVFYQGRREWMLQIQRTVTAGQAANTPPAAGV